MTVTASLLGCAAQGVRSSAAGNPNAKEWIDLFNGKNLDGWTAKIAKHNVGENYAKKPYSYYIASGLPLSTQASSHAQ